MLKFNFGFQRLNSIRNIFELQYSSVKLRIKNLSAFSPFFKILTESKKEKNGENTEHMWAQHFDPNSFYFEDDSEEIKDLPHSTTLTSHFIPVGTQAAEVMWPVLVTE